MEPDNVDQIYQTRATNISGPVWTRYWTSGFQNNRRKFVISWETFIFLRRIVSEISAGYPKRLKVNGFIVPWNNLRLSLSKSVRIG
jgi:hypothetical protein